MARLPPALRLRELRLLWLALRSMAVQIAVVTGPAIGGLLFTLSAQVVYAVAVVLFAGGLTCILALRSPGVAIADAELGAAAPRFATLLAGIRLIRRTPTLL